MKDNNSLLDSQEVDVQEGAVGKSTSATLI